MSCARAVLVYLPQILSITIYLGIRRSEAAALGLNLKQIAKVGVIKNSQHAGTSH